MSNDSDKRLMNLEKGRTTKGTTILDNVKNRMLVKAKMYGVCEPSETDDPTYFPEWRKHKRELMLYGLIDPSGKITAKGEDALAMGRYRRTSKGKLTSVSLDEVTVYRLRLIGSEILMTDRLGSAIKYCVAQTFKELGLRDLGE